jgi:hypothetical protein
MSLLGIFRTISIAFVSIIIIIIIIIIITTKCTYS